MINKALHVSALIAMIIFLLVEVRGQDVGTTDGTESYINHPSLNSAVFKEYWMSYSDIYRNADLNLEAVIQQYLNNQVPDAVRVDLYKKIFEQSDFRNWMPELRSILLYQLVETDKNSETPAYMLRERSFGEFVERINEIIRVEFAELDKKIKSYEEEYAHQGLSVPVEVSEQQKLEAIQEVYKNTFEGKPDLNLFIVK